MYAEHTYDQMYAEQMHDAAEPVGAVEWQASLFAGGEPGFDPALGACRRIELDDACWVDHLPRWLEGSDHVFAELVARIPWRHRTVPMYDRMVEEPRLTWWWAEGSEPIPLPVLDSVRSALSSHYARHLDSMGCNYYRNGRDSVAWHGDRVRHQQDDPLVVTLSVGAPRPFQLRPRGGGRSLSFLLGQGDLLVMGGAAQHRWEHSVPKVAAAGPRISITYRHDVPQGEAPPESARSHHPSAGAQNRHVAATGSVHPLGTLNGGRADAPGSWPVVVRPETEGPPA